MSKKEQAIVSEIVDKCNDYEVNMADFFSQYSDISDSYTLKDKKQSRNGYSSYRTAETHRAVNTVSAFMYRGITSAEPFFEVKPMDIIGMMDNSALLKIENTIKTQLKYSRFKQNLWLSCAQAALFGTAVVQEPFYDIKLNSLGRKLPITGFEPRSLLTTYFDRNASNINKSDYVINLDMMSATQIGLLAKTDPMGNRFNEEAIKRLIEDSNPMRWPEEVHDRLSSAGYTDVQLAKYREILTYAGKFECLGDGLEYIAMVGNRKELIAFYANPTQSGMRPFKVSRYIPWELELLGYGIGILLGSLQKSIDNNRNKWHDRTAVATMGINLIDRYGGISPSDFSYFQNKLILTENMSAVMPLPMDYNSITAGMNLENKLTEEMRAASGATDTLQAISSESDTATEASMVQNSAIRNLSVRTELFAEDFVKPHIEYMHDNNTRNLSYPFVVSINGAPVTVYPNDMLTDVDFEVITTTDKDFRPNRMRRQIEFLQILTSTKSQLPPQAQQKIGPLFDAIVKDMAKGMGLNLSQINTSPTALDMPMGADLAQSGVMAGMQAAGGGMEAIQNGLGSIG